MKRRSSTDCSAANWIGSPQHCPQLTRFLLLRPLRPDSREVIQTIARSQKKMKAAHRAFFEPHQPQPPSPTRYTSFTALLRRLLPDYHRSNPVTCISRFLIHLILHLLASHDPPVSVPRLPGRTSQQRLNLLLRQRNNAGERPVKVLFNISFLNVVLYPFSHRSATC